MSAKTLTASCLCKKVKIEVPDEFVFMGNCHCSECRKFTGSDYSSAGGVKFEDFNIVAGEEFVTTYQKTDVTELGFCKCCGSSLFSKKLARGIYVLRLGTLDDVPSNKPSFHIFTESKAPWNEICDNLKQFPEGPQ